jgi:hypothetical protein
MAAQRFGRYAEIISMFANFYQPRMVEAFHRSQLIEFGIEYRWRKNESKLLLAQKEATPNQW